MATLDTVALTADAVPGLPPGVSQDAGRQTVRAVLWALFRKHRDEIIPIAAFVATIPVPPHIRPFLTATPRRATKRARARKET
jgi:hypothetical protein